MSYAVLESAACGPDLVLVRKNGGLVVLAWALLSVGVLFGAVGVLGLISSGAAAPAAWVLAGIGMASGGMGTILRRGDRRPARLVFDASRGRLFLSDSVEAPLDGDPSLPFDAIAGFHIRSSTVEGKTKWRVVLLEKDGGAWILAETSSEAKATRIYETLRDRVDLRRPGTDGPPGALPKPIEVRETSGGRGVQVRIRRARPSSTHLPAFVVAVGMGLVGIPLGGAAFVFWEVLALLLLVGLMYASLARGRFAVVEIDDETLRFREEGARVGGRGFETPVESVAGIHLDFSPRRDSGTLAVLTPEQQSALVGAPHDDPGARDFLATAMVLLRAARIDVSDLDVRERLVLVELLRRLLRERGRRGPDPS